jgi:hypothetical protein
VDGTVLDRHSGKLAAVGLEMRDSDPLTVLQRLVDEWIAKVKSQA